MHHALCDKVTDVMVAYVYMLLALVVTGVAYGPRAHIQLRNSRTLRCSNVGSWQVRLCLAWVALQLAIFEVIPTWATEID